jgi:NDP-mannose synthase
MHKSEEPTGTAGSLAFVRGLKDTFLAMNNDLLTDLALNKLVRFQQTNKAALTIATHMRQVRIDLGVLELGDDYCVKDCVEKPTKTFHVSMGIYVYEPRIHQFIEKEKYLDFPDLLLRFIAAGEKVCAFPTDCHWLDIGRPDDYANAQELFSGRKEDVYHV